MALETDVIVPMHAQPLNRCETSLDCTLRDASTVSVADDTRAYDDDNYRLQQQHGCPNAESRIRRTASASAQSARSCVFFDT